MTPGLVIYAMISPFIKEPKSIAQLGSRVSYKLFYLLAPHIVLKPDLLDELPNNAIFISTHQSILDFPALATFIKNYLIFANVNLSKFPLVAKISHIAGVRYIKGRSLGEIGQIYKELEEHLDNGNNVIYFPEGTRHDDNKLLPFKRGAFRLSKKKEIPIVPIVIEGASKLLPKKAFCFRTDKKTNVHIKMLPPLYPKDFKNEIEMMHYAQTIMQKEKDRLCELS